MTIYTKRFQYHPPWEVTEWWKFQTFLSSDEYGNPSASLILPMLGWFVTFYGKRIERAVKLDS